MSCVSLETRLEKVIADGEAVKVKTYHPRSGVMGAGNIQQGPFEAWKVQAMAVLQAVEGVNGVYGQGFASVTRGAPYASHVDSGLEVVRRVLEDVRAGYLAQALPSETSLDAIRRLCDRFYLVTRQLRQRHNDRATLSVADEYDVQDLMHALLHLHFEDIRAEEWTPSYAGGSSRVDFLLKNEELVLEIKKTRQGLNARKLGEELIIDISRYQSHPGCKTLICFVYDPDGFIANPRGVENDLNQDTPLSVRVFIRPA